MRNGRCIIKDEVFVQTSRFEIDQLLKSTITQADAALPTTDYNQLTAAFDSIDDKSGLAVARNDAWISRPGSCEL